MSNIGTFNSNNNNPISYAKKADYTERVEKFVQRLHDFIPVITQEYDDLERKAQKKHCKAFDDKMKGLNDIFNAEKDLYYWYIQDKQRSV